MAPASTGSNWNFSQEKFRLSTATDQAAPKVFPAYLRPKEAAQYLGISHSLLAKQVRKNAGPARRRVGRAVLYAVADLNAWMETRVA